MDQDGTFPTTTEGQPAPAKIISRWRWWLHLVVLTLFPLLYAGLGLWHPKDVAVLPDTVSDLIRMAMFELGIFAVMFGGAWVFSRANAEQLLLRWRGEGKPVLLGMGYSIALRGLVMMVLLAVVVSWVSLTGAKGKDLKDFRPQTENLINTGAMLQSPLYFTLCLTLISFVVAALREELWRAGMFAGINALFPKQFADWRGKAVAVCFVALLFGMGHSIQGIGGVGVTAVLGIGLGTIMVLHKSIWEAVIAHGFFDATTFAMLYFVVKHFPDLMPH